MADKQKAVSTEVKSDPFYEMVERVSANPDVDAEKLQRLLDMNMQVLDRQARDEFYDAMNRVQAQLPAIAKTATNPQTSSSYATLDSIIAQVRPIYTKEGLSTSFTEAPTDKADHIRVVGTLRHRAGHREIYEVTMPLDMAGIKGQTNKTRVHATGSSFHYARRYLTCLMFDIATGDDLDGNMPAGYLDEERQQQVETALSQLHPDDIDSFWKKARPATEITELLAHRWESYASWFERKGVELDSA